jgi:transcriptional regulator NrdR family protein
MLTITKRSQAVEEFRKDKIENSMMNAGVSRETAQNVVNDIVYHEGMTTLQVRNRVIGGIKNREPQAAMRYESHPKKTHRM